MLQKILFISVLQPLAYLARVGKSPDNTIHRLSACRLWY